jgi:hypothetical protein
LRGKPQRIARGRGRFDGRRTAETQGPRGRLLEARHGKRERVGLHAFERTPGVHTEQPHLREFAFLLEDAQLLGDPLDTAGFTLVAEAGTG